MFQWKKKRQEERRRAEFGENPFECGKAVRGREFLDEIRLYYEETKELLPEEQIDEVTWNDLEMDEVFLRINHTRSYIGEQVLYRRLHDTSWMHEENVQKDWEKKIAFYEKEEADRLKLEEKLEAIGKSREDYYLPMFLLNTEVLKVSNVWIYQVLQVLLAASLLFGIFLDSTILRTVFMGIVLINVSVYAMCKIKYEAYLYALGSVKRLVLFCKMVVTRPEWTEVFDSEEIKTEVKALEKLVRLTSNFETKKRGAITGDAMDILRDYLIGATLWDITTFNRIVTLLDGKKESLLKLYEFAGEVDMGISVASFRASLPEYCLPEYCLPEICGDRQSVKVLGLYHPLMEKAVRNDFELRKSCMITGANASGKSTFMKAVAVNAILGQTIHTCTAGYLKMPKMRILTSMAVRDDILSGESYYIREIGYLKRIVEAVEGKIPVFCMIDEILRGTNTTERIAASEAVLRYLAEKNCIAMVATHDMELVESLKEKYECFYFKSDIRDEDILFDYKIHKGIGENRNAIKLLAYMGFPAEIVDRAEKLMR